MLSVGKPACEVIRRPSQRRFSCDLAPAPAARSPGAHATRATSATAAPGAAIVDVDPPTLLVSVCQIFISGGDSMRIGYARVSSLTQDYQAQIEALKAA